MNRFTTKAAIVILFSCACLWTATRARGEAQTASSDGLRSAQQAVVALSGEDAKGQPIATGVGFFIRPGLLATDYRVIKDAIHLRAQLPGQAAVDAQVIAVDERRLVALATVRGASAEPLQMACTQAKAGSKGFVIASAAQSKDAIAPVSIIADRDASRLPKPKAALPNDAAGSPVCDESGKLAGIVVRSPENGTTILRIAPAIVLRSLISVELPCDEAAISEAFKSLPPLAAAVVGPGDVPAGVPAAGANVENRPGVIRKEGAVFAGQALRHVPPLYPPLAKTARIQGPVVVEVTVDEEGDVLSARVISGHPLLKDGALNAARAWKFAPTTLDGKPVKVIGQITFNFNL